MNTRNLKLIFLLLLLTASAPIRSQNAVVIQQLVNFPDLPNDSVYEGQLYTFQIIVQNLTNAVVTGNLQIEMRVDSISSFLGSPATQITLQPSDTVSVYVQGYGFQQPQFKAGNNIVVVWPNISSGVSYPIDSVITDVYFIPLNSVLVPFVPQSEFELFPNPATDLLSWNLQDGNLPGRVRIFDARGRLVQEYGKVRNCSVAGLPRGVYFIELEIDSSIVRERFVKL